MSDEPKTTSDPDLDWRVVEVVPEGGEVTSLVMTGPDVREKTRYRPGQFGSIRVLTDQGWSEPHPFTLSCAPGGDSIRMTIKRAGAFTKRLADMGPGAPVRFQGPFGTFLSDVEEQSEIVMVAGGVGITPFLSCLRHFRRTGFAGSVVLVWANKTLADAFAAQELADMTQELDLRVVHVLSRQADLPEPPPGNRIVFETGHVDRALIRRHAPRPEARFYLCGPPAMQDFVLAEMAACGIDPAGVDKEAFAYAGKKNG